jgi:hypothetical protein
MTLPIAVGTPVARKRISVVHVASQVSGHVVLSRCGNTLIAPRRHSLRGELCPTCQEPKP